MVLQQTDNPKEGWVSSRLAEIAHINPGAINDLDGDLEVSFVPMKAVEAMSGRVDLTELRTAGEVRKGYTAFRDGDVIWAKITPCMENGKVAVMRGLKNGLGFGSTEFHVLRPRFPDVLPEWVFFFLTQRSVRRDARNNMTGSAGQLRVPVTYLTGMELPVPPLVEQRAIVAKIEELFSELDKGIEQLQAVKQQLKQYRQAVLQAAFEGKLTAEWRAEQQTTGNLPDAEELLDQIRQVREERYQQLLREWKQAVAEWEAAGGRESGQKMPRKPGVPEETSSFSDETMSVPSELPRAWRWIRVADIGEVRLGRQRSPKNVSKDYPTRYIRAANITENGLDLSDLLEMEFTPDERETYRLQIGDVVLSEASGSPDQVGKPAVWKGELDLCCFQNTVIRLRSDLPMSQYLLWLFRYCYQCGLFVQVAGGVGINHLSASKFAKLGIPLPPMDEQRQMVDQLERRLSVLDELEEAVAQGLEHAEVLRQSVLRKAFEGRLLTKGELAAVRNHPEYEPADRLLERIRTGK